jgi:hypothetical protein
MDFLHEAISFKDHPFLTGRDEAETGTDGNTPCWAITSTVLLLFSILVTLQARNL